MSIQRSRSKIKVQGHTGQNKFCPILGMTTNPNSVHYLIWFPSISGAHEMTTCPNSAKNKHQYWKVKEINRSIHHDGTLLAPVPLNIELTNSIEFKICWQFLPPNFNNSRPITTKFGTRHDSTTVVTCTKFRYDRPTILESTAIWISSKIWIRSNLVNSIFSGTGAR